MNIFCDIIPYLDPAEDVDGVSVCNVTTAIK